MSTGPALTSLRDEYERKREEIRQQCFHHQQPRRALESLTSVLDRLVHQVAARHLGKEPICVVALGGYGRRELYPHSDVDILFLYRGRDEASTERVIKNILHDLWDLRLELGHQVWSMEALGKGEEERHLGLALLDSRVVAGDEALGEELTREIFPKFVAEHGNELIQKILEMTKERHARYRDTIYQLEPDVKDSPGGLRDYLVGRWLLRLQQNSAFVPYSQEQVERSHDVLRQIRIFLHFLTDRNQNQLTHRLQEEISPLLGYGRSNTRSSVESLMSTYFLNARVLAGFCRKSLQPHDPDRDVPKIDWDRGVTVPATAARVVDVFHRSVTENRPLDDRVRNDVVQSLARFSETLDFPRVRQRVRELFVPRRGLYRTLSEMYELGVLEILFPEFGSIKARLTRDFYHKYTVDEHSLLAIKNIEDLLTAEQGSDRRFRALLEEVEQPELLPLALLLHDVGKSREGKHVDRSARMAVKSLRRFRFPREDSSTILFLICHHLAMSQVIFKRDLEDEQVVGRFADLVGDTEHLRLLCLLTFADIKAVAPGTLNEWKKELLWQLYVSTYQRLTLGYGEERIEEEDVGERILEGLPEEFDVDDFEEFLEGFPRRYLTSTPPSEVYQHYRLASRLTSEDPIQLRLVNRKTYWELCVVTPDRYYLFAKIAGLLSYFDMNILRGYGFANRQNTVLDLFQFTDTRDVFRLNPLEKERFQQLLIEAIQDKRPIEKLLEGKERSPLFQSSAPRFDPAVYFADEQSDEYSIMEIVAPDSLGLLYRIGREISALRSNIELVLISTEGGKAVDVFYLTYEGKKLPAEMVRELSERITGAIRGAL